VKEFIRDGDTPPLASLSEKSCRESCCLPVSLALLLLAALTVL
jgi:hypothetical protein